MTDIQAQQQKMAQGGGGFMSNLKNSCSIFWSAILDTINFSNQILWLSNQLWTSHFINTVIFANLIMCSVNIEVGMDLDITLDIEIYQIPIIDFDFEFGSSAFFILCWIYHDMYV